MTQPGGRDTAKARMLVALANLNRAIHTFAKEGRLEWAEELARVRNAIERDLRR
jgi:hypothetical protein